MLEKEKRLIRQKYEETCPRINNSEYHIRWLDEKIKHSYQVLGAGNYIIRHEKDFHNRTPEFVNMAKTALISSLEEDVSMPEIAERLNVSYTK